MGKLRLAFEWNALGVAAACLLAACTTVNKLDKYPLRDASLAVDMAPAPDPSLDVNYDLTLNSHDPVGSVISLGTNIAKAAEAGQAEDRMRTALESVDVPAIVRGEAWEACASALGARKEEDRYNADYLLDLSITHFGIDTQAPWGAVQLRVQLTASLYYNESSELVWRREIDVHEPASPSMFGLGRLFGNLVTTGVLANLTTDQLAAGFAELARSSAREVGRTLHDDLFAVRYD